jgi:hypothetical protein
LVNPIITEYKSHSKKRNLQTALSVFETAIHSTNLRIPKRVVAALYFVASTIAVNLSPLAHTHDTWSPARAMGTGEQHVPLLWTPNGCTGGVPLTGHADAL